ncbi:MAG: hypothetical protein ACTSWQ_06765 [Candidatus Thorarchaeota archaeon]
MALRVTRQFGEVLGGGDGKLRVTRQMAEVLGSGEGKLRVTRQYIEVLALASVTYEKTLTQNLGITDELRLWERHERLKDTMTLTQRVPAQFSESLLQDLDLEGAASRVQSKSLTDNLNLEEIFTELLNVGEHTSFHDTLAFVQDIDFEAGLFNVMETKMTLTQSVNVIGPIYKTMWTRMHLYDGFPYEDYFEKLEDHIQFSDWAGRDYEAIVSSTMSLTQDMWRSGTPTTNMNLVQSLDWGKTKGIPAQWLNLEHIVDLSGDWSRVVIDTLGIGHSLTYYLPDPCDDKAYTPFIGESDVTDSPTPPDSDVPFVQGLPEGERFLLLYPALGESIDIVELRAPNLDNRERQSFTRVNRETRGGKLSIFADPTWPKINTLVLSFSGLTKAEVEETQQFMVDHIGQEIGIIDWEGRQWVGIITTPNERAVQDGKHGFTITFEFEGLMVEEMPSGNAITIVDSFSHYFHKSRPLTDTIEWTAWTQRWVEFSRSLSDTLVMTDEVVETVESP